MKVLLRHTYTCLTLLYSLTILYSCNGDRAFRERLTSIDSLLQTCPDSAYNILSSIEDEAQDQASSNRMYYELLRADAQNKAYVNFTTDSVMKQVAQYYEDHGTPNQQMRAYYLLGCTYRDMGDAPTELEYFQKAVESADTTASNCDYHTLVAVYGQMANIYDNQFLHKEELAMLKQVEKISLISNDTISALKAQALRIRPYYIIEEHDSVLAITQRTRKLFLRHGEKKLAAQYLFPSIHILIDQEKWEEASQLLSIFENESGSLDNNENILSNNFALYYYLKGMLLLHYGEANNAINMFHKLCPYREYEAMSKGLLDAYSVIDNSDSISKYARLYALYNDSSCIKNSQVTTEQLTTMYNYNRHRIIAEQHRTEANEAKHWLQFVLMAAMIIILCIIIGIAVILFIYHKKGEEQKNKNLLLTKSYNNAIIRLHELEEQIHQATTTPDTEGANDLQSEINELRREINRLKSFDDNIEFNAWLENFKNALVVNELHGKAIKILPNTNTTVDDKIWKKLFNHYRQNASTFYNVICSSDSKLNDMDIIVVMLTVLDFTGKEISNLLSKTPQHISNTRHRIYSKLLPTGNNPRDLHKELLIMLHNTLFEQ